MGNISIQEGTMPPVFDDKPLPHLRIGWTLQINTFVRPEAGFPEYGRA